jgi:hypothetical protein
MPGQRGRVATRGYRVVSWQCWASRQRQGPGRACACGTDRRWAERPAPAPRHGHTGGVGAVRTRGRVYTVPGRGGQRVCPCQGAGGDQRVGAGRRLSGLVGADGRRARRWPAAASGPGSRPHRASAHVGLRPRLPPAPARRGHRPPARASGRW